MKEETKLTGGGELADKRWMGKLLSLDFSVRIFCLILQLSNEQSTFLPPSQARCGKSCRPPKHCSKGSRSQLACHTFQIKLTVCKAALFQPQHHLSLSLLASNLEQPDSSQQPEHVLRADTEPGEAGDEGSRKL